MTTATTVQRVSVWVWLPSAAHAELTAVAAGEGVSLPVLARRAAVRGVSAADGGVSMPAPTGKAVEELPAAGYEVNRLLPALEGRRTGCGQTRHVTLRSWCAATTLMALGGIGGGWCG